MILDTLTLLSIGAALLLTLALLVILMAGRAMLARDTGVDNRLDAYLKPDRSIRFVADAPQPQLAERLNETINRQGFAERIAHSLEQANLRLTVPEYLLIRLAVPLLFALLGLFLVRSLGATAIAALVGLVLPSLWIRSRRKRRNFEFNEQLAETLTMIVSSLRGGFSLVQALANTTREVSEPTKSELRRVSQELQLGVSLPQALNNLVQRVESEDLDLVVTAININARVGGNLTAILETISATIRERAKLRREVRVITSMQRISSYVIGGLPLGLAAVIFVINPTYMLRLFQPGWTLCIPVGAVACAACGFVIIQRIIDIKV